MGIMLPKTLRRIGQIYFKAIEWLGAYLIVLVALSMLEMAFSRTVFHFAWSALDKINVIAIIWACLLLAGPLVKTEGHIAVNYFSSRLTGLRLYFLKLFINVALLVTFVIVAYYGFFAFKGLYETGSIYPAEIDIPQWLTRLPVFLGMVLGLPFVLHALINSITSLYGEFKKKKEENKS
jgi:TRAP-type C4-dicarboxylate transport system permease small subunit